MKYRFLLRWVVLLSLVILAFILAQSNLNVRAAASHAGMPGMKVVVPTNASWHVVSSPNPGGSSELHGVAAVSASDVWAVGAGNFTAASAVYQTLIEQWNGTSWRVVPSFDKEGSQLESVAAISASDVWAVGDYGGNTLIENWDGTSWNVVFSPNPSGGGVLESVTAVSANDVWAVGWYLNTNGVSQTLIEQWDGTSWSIVPSPNPSTSDNILHGVAAVSASDVWAVGTAVNVYTDQTLIEQWNGTSWRVVPSPNPGTFGNQLSGGVTALSASDVLAVGNSDYSATGTQMFSQQTLVEQWNGTSWHVVSSPSPGTADNVLTAVAGVSTSDVWAVGSYDNVNSIDDFQTLTEQWDGTSWRVVKIPNPSKQANFLNAVTTVSTSDVWAVGSYNDISDSSTLTEHYSGQDGIEYRKPWKSYSGGFGCQVGCHA